MRVPRVRFTVRRMMVAVAVAALLLGAAATLRRRAILRELADSHAATARRIRTSYTSTIFRDGAYVRPIPPRLPRLADYHEVLADKYRRAARRPWLPVAPDPPEPE